MTRQNPTDADLITAIQGTRAQNAQALEQLYNNQKWRQMVIHHVDLHGGSIEDAKEVFQETMLIFDHHIRAGTYERKDNATLKTYFMSIARWYWYGFQRKNKRYVGLNAEEHIKEHAQSPEAAFLSQEKQALFDTALKQLGEKCYEILSLYKLSYSMEEIAEELKLSSPESAKTTAYQCRLKFRKLLEAQPELLKILRG